MMKDEDIAQRVKTLYSDAVVDIVGEDCSFEMYVISEGFAGQSRLQRQQSILTLFNEELQSGVLHALSVKTKTPGEQNAPAVGLVQIQPLR